MKPLKYVLLMIALLFVIGCFLSLNAYLDTIYDEGFLFLQIQNAQQVIISGESQWSSIVAKCFGEEICNNILFLRYSRFCLSLFTVVLFSICGFFFLNKRYNIKFDFIWLLSLVLFLSSLSLSGIILCYNGLQQLFLMAELGLFLVVISSQNNLIRYVLLFGIGAVSFFSLMTILPSGILILLSILILLCLYSQKMKVILLSISVLLTGCVIGGLAFHLIINDLGDVWNAMEDTAAMITTLNRGYDPISFVVKILLFMRDWILMVVYSVGCFYLFECCCHFFNNKRTYMGLNVGWWIGLCVYLCTILVYVHYQKNPTFTTAMFLSNIIICAVILINEHKNQYKYVMDWFSFDGLLRMFLFLFPLIASIGTNVYLGSKMTFFVVSWSVLIVELIYHLCDKSIINRIYPVLIVSLLLLFSPMISHLRGANNGIIVKQYNNTPIAGVKITKEQYAYFQTVNDILGTYNYNKNADYVFSTQLDMMTLTLMGANSVGLYFQPMDFVVESKKYYNIPNFLFLNSYDIDIAGNKLRNIGWGWPEDFDKYYVGTPEVIETSYPTERWLYCRKSKRVK